MTNHCFVVLMYEQFVHGPDKLMSVFLSIVAYYKWEKQDRTNPSNYNYQDKYQVHSSERNQNFVQEKMIGDIGHICRVTLGLPMLERLKQMIVHLTTVVPNWQSRPWFAPSYLRISSIANQSTPNQLATLPSIWHFSGLQLAQNWHQNVRDLRRNVTQYYNCMMHVLAKIKRYIKRHETR